MNENSLFAILLRSQWWVSGLVALGVIGVLRFLMPTPYAIAAALPFIGISAYVLSKRLRAPSGRRIAATLERLRAMPWSEFSAAVAAAYARQGYEVRRVDGGPADLALVRDGYTTLVACKRWKATRTGVEPLREFHAAASRREADERIYVAAGEVSDKARTFAAEHRVRLIEQGELARLLLKVR
ncbi:MAG TPA: restriction endonuclease [Burkholderiales bacterium]